MARKQPMGDDDGPGKVSPRGKRRVKRRYLYSLVLLGALVGLTVILPTLATSRFILLPVIDHYAGIGPVKVEFARISAGWFSPVSVDGLQLFDGQGNSLVKIGKIQTQKGLLAWITSSQSLGTIQINDVEADVVVAEGTTSLEKAIEPLLQSAPEETPSSSAHYSGAIELANVRIALRDTKHPDVWLVTIPTLKTQLPAINQVLGPTQLSASIADASGAAGGTIAADVAETLAGEIRSFNVRAVVEHVPLAFWHILHERLPEIPIEALSGSISARIAGSLVDDQRWSIHVERLAGEKLVVTAPTIVGMKPARLESIQVQGKAGLAAGGLVLDAAQIMTDFGIVKANGNMPWPIVMPSITSPWLAGAQLNAEGSIDLARLVQVAETLVPMRQDTRLIAGAATFRAVQALNANGQPSSSLDIQLGDLVATANGQQLKWEQPLKLSVAAQPQADGQLRLNGQCNAEFCTVAASGSALSGEIKGQVSLDRLQQRLSQWIELPLTTMTGDADIDLQWTQTQPGLIAAQGKLKTSPVVIAISSGGQLREPAWQGLFTGQGRIVGTQFSVIERANIELVAPSEQLKVDLLEPLHLIGQHAPASFTVSSEGSLDLWQKRAVMLKMLDPSITLVGKYTLGASGRVDANHLELLQANWRSQPFEVGSGGTTLVEPEMVGNFQGRVDTNDLTKLAIEKLVVQAHSFSLTATDAASPSGDGSRNGTGAFIADLGQLMRSVRSDSASVGPSQLVLPPGVGVPPSAPASQMALSGQLNGNLRWQLSGQAASLEVEAKSDQIDLIQQTAGGQPQRLWSEAQVMASTKAAWDAATGNIKMESMQFQAPWMHYVGNAEIITAQGTQTILAKGECLYDAGLIATKLQPYIGSNVQMAGRKKVPVDVRLTMGGPGSATSLFAGLQASTRIGWEQARVVGIDVGPADVPLGITAGQLTTRAEIPVSGGTLRWDIQSDLTSPQTVLIQQPMMVLENAAITPQMCQSWLKYVTPLLAEATSVDGRLSLQLTEARYNIANPRDQIVDGKLIIHSAAIGPGPLSNQVITLVQQVNALRKKELTSAVSSQQVWLQMPAQTIAFRMENGRVIHRDLKFNVGDVNLFSSGAVDIDGRMDLNTQMPIPDDWIAKSPFLAGLRGQSLQFPIRGSLTSPQVDSQFLKDFGRQAVTSAAEGLLQQQLSRGLGKLFGPMPIPPTSTPQPVTPGTVP